MYKLILATTILLAYLSGCVNPPAKDSEAGGSSNSPADFVVNNGLLAIKGTKAYITKCTSAVTSTKEGGQWRVLRRASLPDEGKPYYLDGKLESYSGLRMWCDHIDCVAYKPFSIEQITAPIVVQVGINQPGNIPVYETITPNGNLKVSFNYYTDAQCQQRNKRAAVFYLTHKPKLSSQ
jgi:hypothetical protein